MIGDLLRRLDGAASQLATRLADWSVLHAMPSQREWSTAIRSELQSIDDGVSQLRWAAGGAWIVARQTARIRMGVSAISLKGGLVPSNTIAPWVGAIGRNFIAIFLFWCCLTASQFVETVGGGWEEQSLQIIVACAAGLASAIWIRAGFVAYLLAGQVAFGVAEIVFHLGFGIHVVQGASAHFSVMIAGTIAAALNGAAQSRNTLQPIGRVWKSRDLIASARDAVAALDSQSRVISTLLVVSLAWAVPELLARAPIAGNPYRDSVTDWAIALAALIGSVLGSITARLLRTRQPTASEVVCASAE